jgi:proteasome activator subunit 4
MIYRNRHHVSYSSVQALMDSQAQASSVGCAPYQPTTEFTSTMEDVFQRLEKWRHERPPGQQSQSSYTSASKTVLLWLETTLSSHECTQLIPFFPKYFMPEMLHMMDIKEDPELMSLAYHVFRHLPNIPHPVNQDHDFISSLIRIGTTSTLWHQRLRVLINMQVIYFRRLFLISREEQERLFTSVSNMLEDSQLEVRLGAAATLSGMIRCSPVRLREGILEELQIKFTDMLIRNPLPRRAPAGTPTPDYTRITLVRHAAVLGLGALVQAFPYTSPPPSWLPEVLATLASRAAGDPGMVGKSVKSALGEFKKTRQDTWHVDVKVSS